MTLHDAHDTNARHKANRAVIAIEAVAQRFIVDDTEHYAEANTLTKAMELMHWMLFGPDIEPGWWAAVGVMHDLNAGKTGYGPKDKITGFHTSRFYINQRLTRRIVELKLAEDPAETPAAPMADDPFDIFETNQSGQN